MEEEMDILLNEIRACSKEVELLREEKKNLRRQTMPFNEKRSIKSVLKEDLKYQKRLLKDLYNQYYTLVDAELDKLDGIAKTLKASR